MANVPNYMEQGGETLHIGGNLVIDSGGKLKFGSTEFKQCEAVAKAASTAPTKAEFDALIDALTAAGIMKASG